LIGGCKVKVETRGKYPGVKVHLDPEECEALIEATKVVKMPLVAPSVIQIPFNLARNMGAKIRDLLDEQPNLLQERTPEQIAAILAKDHEKAALQLNRLKNGKDWKKIEPEALKKALAHYTEVK
jgi:hypothetical protein